MKPIESLCKETGSWDLKDLIFPSSSKRIGWKSAPDVSWLSSSPVAKLCSKLFQVCPNGVIASKKLKGALYKIAQEHHRLNFSRMADSSFYDATDDYIRIACSMYRTLKKDVASYTRFTKKASAAEKAIVDEVTYYLSLEPVQTPASAGNSSDALPTPPPATSGGVEMAGPGCAIDSAEQLGASASCFKRILAKQESDEAVVVAPGPGASSASQAALVPVGFSSSSGVDVAQSPPEQLRRSMASYFLDERESEELEKWMLQDVDTTKPKTAKQKKSATAKAGKAKAAPKKKATPKKKAKAKAKAVSKKQSRPKKFKRSWRHRKSSAAYHQAFAQALREGKPEEEAKEVGRAARLAWSLKVQSGEIAPSQ